MNIRVDRIYKKKEYTIGKVYVNDVYFSDCVEDADRGLDSSMPSNKLSRMKIAGKTAIPKGRYKIDMNTVSPKFRNKSWAKKYGGIVPRLLNVPCWSGVLIHPLNYASESEGCIGVGKNKVKGGVIKSVEYFYKLMDEHLLPAKNRGEQIWITVK